MLHCFSAMFQSQGSSSLAGMAGNFITDVQGTFDGLFGKRKTTPKRQRFDDTEGQEPKLVPVAPATAEWVQDVVGAGITTVATKMHERLLPIESELITHQEKIEKIDTTLQAHKDAIEDLQRKFEGLSARTQAQQPSPPVQESIPHELRCHAVIGGLGYDTPAETLIERAKQLLTEARIPAESYYDIKAMREGPGSMCEMYFKEAGMLTKAKWAVSTLKKCVHGNKPAWLDAKKTKQELRPARMVHRACEVLQSYEDSKIHKAVLSKNMIDKKVLRNGVAVGASRYGKWMWTEEGAQHYTEEQRKHAEDWAAAA